ncbi:MAG TPA: Rid family detoxifying hydrolase, partial [Segetibacter sp.]
MEKRVINTSKAPAPIGPYSQAIISNDLLFISGQIALNPVTNELVTSDVATETHQVMRNLHEILEEAGINFNHVVKTTIFLSDMSLF